MLGHYREIINGELSANHNDRVNAKYRWLAEYFNSALTTYEFPIQPIAL
jgi:hypothetical protein